MMPFLAELCMSWNLAAIGDLVIGREGGRGVAVEKRGKTEGNGEQNRAM